jgi:deoxyribonuclease-4
MYLGVHVSTVSKVLDSNKSALIHNAITRDLDTHGLNCAQIFTHGPRVMKANNLDVSAIKKECKEIDLSVHSSYGSVGIWNVNSDNKSSTKSKAIIAHIADQLKSCQKIGAWGLVLHISKHYADDVAYGMTLLKPYAKKTGVTILLEMVASKADDNLTYETPEKIDNLTTLIGPEENWWGWCVDTAHLWGAGVDIQSYKQMSDWLTRLTYKKKILMFHLNGSSAARGSGKDKHEIPFEPEDVMWNGIEPESSGLRAVIEFCVKQEITIICEINRGTQENVTKAIDIIIDLAGI